MKIITIKSSATAALATLALALVPASLQAREITVPSGQIRTIQQGVDAAAPGDTVLVRPGTYVINNNGGGWPAGVEIGPDKPGLKLRAGGPPGSVKIVGVGTISPGPLNWRGISIGADNALVEGFDISGLFQTGISAGASAPPSTRITGNTIHDLQNSFSSLAIGITPGPGNEVDHNTVYGCVWGIMLNGPGVTGPDWQTHLHHNQVSNQLNAPSLQAGGIGIFLWTAPGCRIDHNECNNDGQLGIYLGSSPNCTMEHNQADQNGSVGIALDNSPDCTVAKNEANNNGIWGISVGSSCGSTFERNVAEGNGQYDLFAPNWDPLPTCNTYLDNRADTAWPSLALWDVK